MRLFQKVFQFSTVMQSPFSRMHLAGKPNAGEGAAKATNCHVVSENMWKPQYC
jgi:hypothetical protein